jgi:hypothetical protein
MKKRLLSIKDSFFRKHTGEQNIIRRRCTIIVLLVVFVNAAIATVVGEVFSTREIRNSVKNDMELVSEIAGQFISFTVTTQQRNSTKIGKDMYAPYEKVLTTQKNPSYDLILMTFKCPLWTV